jgi:hypothetical protein
VHDLVLPTGSTERKSFAARELSSRKTDAPSGTKDAKRSEKPVEAERIADAEDIDGCIVVKTHCDVEIDLLGVGKSIAATGLEMITRARVEFRRWLPFWRHSLESDHLMCSILQHRFGP